MVGTELARWGRKKGVVRRSLAMITVAVAATVFAACGPDDGRDAAREEAAVAAELAADAAELDGMVDGLAARLAAATDVRERHELADELDRVDAHAERLIERAEVEDTYEVDLASLNDSGLGGTISLVLEEGRLSAAGPVFGTIADPSRKSVAIYSFGPAGGASVCPPDGAATGRDGVFSEPAGAGFYGPIAVELGSLDSRGDSPGLSALRDDAARLAPLKARALVIRGGHAAEGFDRALPVACGLPVAVPAERSPQAELVAAISAIRQALPDLALIARSPSSDRAPEATARIVRASERANDRLRSAVELLIHELEHLGEVPGVDPDALERILDDIDRSLRRTYRVGARLEEMVDRMQGERGMRGTRDLSR